MEGRTVIVSDLNLTVPPEGQGVGQSVTRTADSDRSLPTQVELLHSVSGGVAVSIDGADPIGEPDAVKEMVAQQEASLARVESGPLAVAAAYPSWCGSSSQYALTGQKWSGKIYQWFTNYSGRPSSMTESARYAAFDAAEGYIEAKNSTCGGSTHSLAVGEVGSTTKAVGVQDGKSTQGWKSLSSGTLALTTWWYAGSSTTEADMAFSTSVSWYAGTGTVPSTKYDLVSIATHEIGHAVGLGNFSFVPVMQHGNIRLSIDAVSAVASNTDEVYVTINAYFSMTILKDGADAFVLYTKEGDSASDI
jgi:hypothetical protein